MKVNLLNTYKNGYSSSIDEQLSQNGITLRKNSLQQKQTNKSIELNNNELLTKTERNFFKKMFPENSNQIDKHVVFNRNGKVESIQISKGVIFDGKF